VTIGIGNGRGFSEDYSALPPRLFPSIVLPSPPSLRFLRKSDGVDEWVIASFFAYLQVG